MKKILSVFLTLAMLATVLALPALAEETLLISPKPEESIKFSDVNKETTDGKAIYKLAEAGILKGDGDGTFRPNDPISRGELTKIVNMIFGYTEKAAEGFKDVTAKDWYYDNVLIAKKAGYIQGHGDGTFKGEDKVTREQACAILCRVVNLASVSEDVKINDAVSDWAMPYVQKVLGNMFMTLDKDGNFRAQKDITRAEFSVVYANFVEQLAPGEDKTDEEKKEEEKKEDKKENSSSGGSGGGGGSSSGGGAGGSSGGSGGSGGSTTPEVDYEEVNKDILTKLDAVSNDITKNSNVFTMEESAEMIYYIDKCIKEVIADGKTNVINKNYLVKEYGGESGYLTLAEACFDAIKADPTKKAKFAEEAASLNSNTINWLMDAFDIDASDLGVSESELKK